MDKRSYRLFVYRWHGIVQQPLVARMAIPNEAYFDRVSDQSLFAFLLRTNMAITGKNLLAVVTGFP